MVLAGGGSEAARDVVGDVGIENFVQAVADRARRRNGVASDLTDADQVAIGRGDENFFGGVEVFGAKGLLDDGQAGFRSDFEQNAASDAFKAAGIEWRSKDFAVLDGEDIRGSAFGYFAALIEHDDFVETFLVGFRDGPDIVEPGDAFDAGKGGGGVAAVLAETEADNIAMLGKFGSIDDEIDDGAVF